jgi:hypothetical protein
VRAICPFCGNTETDGEPCCDEWQQTASIEDPVVAEPRRAFTAVLPGAAAIQRRLGAASQPLVALLASAIIAMCVSLGTQRRLADDVIWKDAIVVGSRIHHSRNEPGVPALMGAATTVDSVVSPPPAVAVPAIPAPTIQHPTESTASMATQPLPPAPPESQGPASLVAPPSAVAAAIPPAALAPASNDTSSTTATVTAAPAAVAPRHKAAAVPRIVRPEPKAPPVEVASIRLPKPPVEEALPRPVVAEALPADSDIARRAEQEAAEMAKVEVPSMAVPATQPPSPWRQLRRGMTQEQVLALLGQPKWKRHLVTTEWWLYKENSLYGTGRIGFSAEEGLISWREP